MENKVIITTSQVTLEGRFRPGLSKSAVVITHPHPLFGGSMDNNVVWTAARACQARDFSTLRFNFRGVGESSGSYGNGLDETEDLKAAVDYLATQIDGPRFLVGYSFGAYVAARALASGLRVDSVALISPPFAFPNLDFLPKHPLIKLIIVGDRDDFCPLAELRNRQGSVKNGEQIEPPEIIVISGADHFFSGYEQQLYQILLDYPW
jgi:uncharacterized protein